MDLAHLSGSQRYLAQAGRILHCCSFDCILTIAGMPRQGLIRTFVEANLLEGGVGKVTESRPHIIYIYIGAERHGQCLQQALVPTAHQLLT